MALIGKIRNNSWLLIVMIGVGLFGFLLTDTFSGNTSIFGSSSNELVEVGGEGIDITEFNSIESMLYGNSSGDPFSRRQYLFNNLVDQKIILKEAEAMGLGVSEEELEELTYGDNPSPIIRQRFFDQQTQSINRQALDNYRNQEIDGTLEPQIARFWNYQKEEIKADRLKSKIETMVQKGIYTPSWMAEQVANESSARRAVALVNIPYEVIENNQVTLQDSDYQNYLSQNKEKYYSKDEKRKISYIVFPIEATEDDKIVIRNQVADIGINFKGADNDTIFVSSNNGQFTQQWFDAETLPAGIKDTVIQLSRGDVYGPYLEDNAYKLAKITQKQAMPDSAKCRHILISASTPSDFASARKTIDSLKNVLLTTNVSFDTLAARHSQDPGSKDKGGVYDFAPVNQYVPEFNDAIFYSANINDLVPVRTQYGVHLVQPMARKGQVKNYYRMAYISEKIIPSIDTQNAIENEAINFVDENRSLEQMTQAANEKNLTIETSRALLPNDFNITGLGSGQTTRDLIRWSFGLDHRLDVPQLNDVSPELYSYQNETDFYTDKFVVAALQHIQKAGYATVADVKDEIEPLVINRAKSNIISDKISSTSDLNSIAALFEEVTVDTINNLTFYQESITNVGIEPDVQGAIFSTPINQASNAIAGNSGVFVVRPFSETPPNITSNLAQQKTTAASPTRSQVKSRLISSLRKNLSFEDNRAKFF